MKFGNMQDWQSDAQLELEGVKYEIGRDRYFTIRRAGGANRVFMTAYSALVSKLGGESPEKIANAMMMQELQPLFAKHVVVGWHGIEDDKGEEIPYSEEAFVALMQSAPDLWQELRMEADKRWRFQREKLAEEKSQMGKLSGGKRNGGNTARV